VVGEGRSSNTGTFSSRSRRRAPTTTRCSDDQRCSLLWLSAGRALSQCGGQ
jgi:hypothetical protein